MKLFGRWLVLAIAVAITIWLVPGIQAVGGPYAGPLFCALALALVDMTIKPIMKVLSIPFTCLTLGLFSLVINAFALQLASWLARNIFGAGITIDSFGAAILGSIIISIVCALLGSVGDAD